MGINLKQKNIAIIGSGQMGEVLIQVLVELNLPTGQITCCDLNQDRLEVLADKYKVNTSLENYLAAEKADVVILAVKPQVMDDVCKEIRTVLRDDQILISIAAGITINFLKERINNRPSIIRIMPNTPCLVKAGISAISISEDCQNSNDATMLVEEIFSKLGKVIFVKEEQLDAITGLSGSGPAYIYLIIEALSDAGVRVGLPRRIATELAIQTVFGSAKMASETNLHPAVLKEMVTSPGGTSITGLHVLERAGVRGIIMDTVVEATKRSKELGN
ncbi:MAG: pyrroline-5-carboxylate reductase [Halanaerobiales bacterium]|nr:pyrroline-5-carboxylate reductase [Halanaerobiales bacterium]